MKVLMITVILAMANVAIAAQQTCSKDLWCQGCNANKCTACVSWVDSEPGARYLSNGKCQTKRTHHVDHCKVYRNDSTDDSKGNICKWCEGKTWLNIDLTTSPANNTCSDTALDATNCTTAIANCDISSCYKNSRATKPVCQRCSAGYWPTNQDPATEQYQGCTKTGNAPIKDVMWFESEKGYPQPYVCAAGYYVTNNGASCKKTKNLIPNCRKLQADGETCAECMFGNYWDGSECKSVPAKKKTTPTVAESSGSTVAEFTASTNPGCPKDLQCQGCHADGNKCTTCFSWGTGSIGARYLKDGKCQAKRTKLVPHCKMYKSWPSNDDGECLQCDGKAWQNIDWTTNPQTYTCSDTPLDAAACKPIPNCEHQVCHKNKIPNDISGVYYEPACEMCSAGYWPKDQERGNACGQGRKRYTSCTNDNNTKNHYNVKQFTSYHGAVRLYICAPGYYLKSDDTYCVNLANMDPNCRKLQADGKSCAECMPSYFWDMNKCVLKAGLYIVNASIAVLLLISFQSAPFIIVYIQKEGCFVRRLVL